MSPNALKKNFACLAFRDSLIVGFFFFFSSFLSNNLQVPLAAGRPGLGTKKKDHILKFSLAFSEFSWGITLAHLLSAESLLKALAKSILSPSANWIYILNYHEVFLKFEELCFSVSLLDLGNRNLVVFKSWLACKQPFWDSIAIIFREFESISHRALEYQMNFSWTQQHFICCIYVMTEVLS